MSLTRRPDGTWAMRLYTHGTKTGPRVYKTLGRMPEHQAKALYRDELAKAARRRGRGGANLTVRALANEWLANHGPELSPRWRTTAEGILRLHLLPFWGDVLANTIRPSDAKRYKARRLQERASNATVNREMAVLRGILSHAVADELLDRHPLPAGAAPRLHEEQRVVYLEPGEWERLRTAFDDPTAWEAHAARIRRLGPIRVDPAAGTERRHGGGRRPDSNASHAYRERLRSIIPVLHFLLLTGSRLGEALRLTWKDVDFTRKTVAILQPKVKKTDSATKVLPLSEELLALLKALPRGTPAALVFQRPGGGAWETSAFENAFRVARTLAGLRPEITIHALRHTAASWLVIRGVPLKTVQTILGHRSIRTTERYAHLAPDHLREAVDVLGSVTRETPRETRPAPIRRQSSAATSPRKEAKSRRCNGAEART